MGSNFYMTKGDKQVHLGKRSKGWAFLFKANAGVTNLRTWYSHAHDLELKGYKLTNDNGATETNLKDLLKGILAIAREKQHGNHTWQDEHGNSFYEREFS